MLYGLPVRSRATRIVTLQLKAAEDLLWADLIKALGLVHSLMDDRGSYVLIRFSGWELLHWDGCYKSHDVTTESLDTWGLSPCQGTFDAPVKF